MATINQNYPSNTPTGNVYIDSLIWGGSWSANNGTTTNITWSASTGNIYSGLATGAAWLSYETAALQNALQTWSNVANVTFEQLSPVFNANIEYYTISPTSMGVLTEDNTILGFHETPDGSANAPLYGVFNNAGAGWTSLGLKQGGYGFLTLIHEIGHGLGLAHPHDYGGGSSIFPGVTDAFASYGDYELNQGIWTIMSYNDGWNQVPSPLVDISYGQAGTPMAFDIAAIQYIYGANMSYQTDNNTYLLANKNGGGTFWSCIWDAGGTDTISAQGSNVSADINLNAAPLVGLNAAGYVSHVTGIVGGFTIANNVIIENAVGGNANDLLVGNSTDNFLTGGAGNDSIDGGTGNDTLNGGTGADTMTGGTGNDTYVVDHVGDTTTELTDEGIDLVRSSISFDLSVKAQYVENLTLTGTSAINGTGNALDNLLTGNAAANILNGGLGIDTLIGGAGNDTYVVDNAEDLISETPNAGTDLVKVAIATADGSYTLADNVENATLTSTVAYSLVGNGLNNRLTGNAAVNTLDGGAGIDTLIGGAGNDTYIIDLNINGTLQDKVVEAALSGDINDTIQLRGYSSNTTTLTLLTNVEHLDASATGTSKLNLTGNAAANILTGNAAANTLNGGAGADILIGGAGNDVLIGGAGSDVFKFESISLNTSVDIDVITDFLSSQLDSIWLSGTIFSILENGVLNETNFVSGISAVALDDTDHIIYNSGTGALYYDADGNGALVSIQFATLVGSPSLQASDVWIGV
jgi:serralysin